MTFSRAVVSEVQQEGVGILIVLLVPSSGHRQARSLFNYILDSCPNQTPHCSPFDCRTFSPQVVNTSPSPPVLTSGNQDEEDARMSFSSSVMRSSLWERTEPRVIVVLSSCSAEAQQEGGL